MFRLDGKLTSLSQRVFVQPWLHHLTRQTWWMTDVFVSVLLVGWFIWRFCLHWIVSINVWNVKGLDIIIKMLTYSGLFCHECKQLNDRARCQFYSITELHHREAAIEEITICLESSTACWFISFFFQITPYVCAIAKQTDQYWNLPFSMAKRVWGKKM